jgi:hypothetical protein
VRNRAVERPEGDERGKQLDQVSGAVEEDKPTETEVEGEIRDFVRRDVPPAAQPESDSEIPATSDVVAAGRRNPVQEIDRLISELQTLREMLHNEARACSAKSPNTRI